MTFFEFLKTLKDCQDMSNKFLDFKNILVCFFMQVIGLNTIALYFSSFSLSPIKIQCSLSQQPVPHTAETVDVSQDSKRPGTAPQAFSSLLLDIQDVDSADAVDAQMCSEYVQDIYSYLQQLEARVWERRNLHSHFYVIMPMSMHLPYEKHFDIFLHLVFFNAAIGLCQSCDITEAHFWTIEHGCHFD